ncbi:hypothetical protein [Abyssalbus ytuae]|uniref:Uncharacterized protein n=1 Tax=Abyssalbus ytuae TaxID=2926907 RepID=A0A9E6ZU80_9FLAO|nr:hypothetical protein [Abyssalbus ytuae]UOB17893.1 hypothetical protein MQE35_01020 [Abyssalbus ytuae]
MNTICKILTACLALIVATGCDDIIEVTDISGKTVTLIAPAQGATVQTNLITFTWEKVDDATQYTLQVAKPDFETAAQVVVDSTMSTTAFSQELLPGNYEWRVKALNSGYETNYYSNNFIVAETDGLAGNTLILNSPANNFATNQTEVTLNWQALTDATEYRVQVLDDTEEVVLDETVTETSIEITFTGEGTFTWQVRAQNNSESTLYSKRNITIDTTGPNTPQPSAPADDATESAGSINFSWIREAIAGSEELDSIYIYTDETLETLFLKDVGTDKNFSTDLQADTYYWNVKAFDTAGNESETSLTFNLTIN